jgi:hypothetical protein
MQSKNTPRHYSLPSPSTGKDQKVSGWHTALARLWATQVAHIAGGGQFGKIPQSYKCKSISRKSVDRQTPTCASWHMDKALPCSLVCEKQRLEKYLRVLVVNGGRAKNSRHSRNWISYRQKKRMSKLYIDSPQRHKKQEADQDRDVYTIYTIFVLKTRGKA